MMTAIDLESFRSEPVARAMVRRIEELGGAYTRANGEGSFSLLVPDRGTYHLLILSRHAQRPADVPIDELDLDEIQKYFASADHLINRHHNRHHRGGQCSHRATKTTL